MKGFKLILLLLITYTSQAQLKRTVIATPMNYTNVIIDTFAIKPTDTTGSKILGRIVLHPNGTLFRSDGSKFLPVTGGGGAAEVTTGTIAQLRALTTGTGKVYTSTDGGIWVDKGLNDGVYTDDGAKHIITANQHNLERQEFDKINVEWFGAKHDSTTDDAPAINSAISYAKTIRNKQGEAFKGGAISLYMPPGKYKINSPIYDGVGIDMVGSGKNSTVIFTTNKSIGGIIMNETSLPANLEFVYTSFRDFSILGGSYLENPFGAKNTSTTYVGSNGIELHNNRIRINEVSVEGWNESGITATGVYYIYADKVFIKNNRVGYTMANVATSNFLKNSEIRLNSIGVIINGNSFGNYVTNNTIESNFSNFMALDNNILLSKGKAIVLTGGATANTVSDNYIEAHITTFAVSGDAGNHLSHNTIITGLPDGSSRSDLMAFYGQSSNDRIEENTILTYTDTIPSTIMVGDGNINYSSTYFSFTGDNFTKIVNNNLTYLKSVFLGVEGNSPVIANVASGVTYRNLLFIPPADETTLGGTYAKWFTTGNGATNNTAGLQAAINKGGNVYLTESYVVSNTLTVPSNTHIIGLKGASIFVANNTNKILFNIVDASNVSIEGLIINGNIANQDKSGTDPLNLPELWSGINMLNSQNVVIRNNIIKNCNGDGITVEGRYTVTAKSNVNKNISIDGNTIYHSGRNGISIIHGDGVSITGNTIYDQKAYTSTLGSGIDIEPNIGNGSEVWVTKNVSISKNVIYDNNEGVMLAGSAVVSTQIIENIKIETNSIYSNKNRNIYAYSLDATKFKTSGVLISDNNFKGDSSLTNSIFINGCHSNININNNDFSNAITPIFIYRSSEANLVNNTIDGYGGTGGGSGIEVYGSSNNNIKINKIKNGNFNSNFLYGIGITSVDATFLSSDNNIEGNEISVTATNKYMFAGIVAVSNNPVWDVIKRNKINGNTFDGITAANTLFVNCKTKDNQIGVNFTQSTPLVADHSTNTLVPYNFTADKSTATTDLPTINNDEGNRRFDNIKHQPTWFNGSKWVTGIIDGYNYGAKEVSKTLTSSFPDGVANQKVDILLPSASFLGDIDISIQSGFLGTNAAGVIKKKFSVGYNPGGTIYSNNSRYTEASGGIKDNFSISDLVWDATLSKFKVTVNHLTSITNPLTVKIGVSSIDTGSTRIIYDSTVLGSIYVGSASVSDAQVEYKAPVRGARATQPTDLLRKDQMDSLYDATAFAIYNARGTGDTLMTTTSNSAVMKRLILSGAATKDNANTNDSTLAYIIGSNNITGTFTFTGDGTTTAFTKTITVTGFSTTSKVFIDASSPIGAALDWVDKSTESITLHYLTAPTAGTKTVNYFIIP